MAASTQSPCSVGSTTTTGVSLDEEVHPDARPADRICSQHDRTDQGSPYASEDYQRVLAAHGITCSMSRRGNAHDNAAMESWFSTMTFELGDRFETHPLAKAELFDYIEVFYNQERRHSTLGYLSPAQFEREARMQQAAA